VLLRSAADAILAAAAANHHQKSFRDSILVSELQRDFVYTFVPAAGFCPLLQRERKCKPIFSCSTISSTKQRARQEQVPCSTFRSRKGQGKMATTLR
jgi:hypothetical protein